MFASYHLKQRHCFWKKKEKKYCYWSTSGAWQRNVSWAWKGMSILEQQWSERRCTGYFMFVCEFMCACVWLTTRNLVSIYFLIHLIRQISRTWWNVHRTITLKNDGALSTTFEIKKFGEAGVTDSRRVGAGGARGGAPLSAGDRPITRPGTSGNLAIRLHPRLCSNTNLNRYRRISYANLRANMSSCVMSNKHLVNVHGSHNL